MLQLDRRRTPYPFTWEIPVGVVAVTLLLLIIGAQTGRGLALLFAGAGWHWPSSRNLLTSLPGILAGKPSAGLTHVPPTATTPAVLGWIIAVELVISAVLVLLAIWALTRWGPSRLRGMATAHEAEATLGVSRLHKHRHIIRPDLHPPKDRRSR